MKVKVVGKIHLQGTSRKTGKPYDFIQVHTTTKSRGVEGDAVKTLMLDPAENPYAEVIVGGEYDAQYDDRGYLQSFLPVRKM